MNTYDALQIILSLLSLPLFPCLALAAKKPRMPANTLRLGRALPAGERSPVPADVWRCGEWLDMVATALEAGLGVLQAYRMATALLLPSRVREEILHAERAFQLGASFPEALEQAIGAARLEPVRRVLRTIEQAQSLGCESAQGLSRVREALLKELSALQQERVARLPVSMLFPLAVFVLPALLVLVCAPLVAQFVALVLGP
jgi:tight adherence protein C